MNNQKLQEYINIVYDNYDTIMLTFPTGVGIVHHLIESTISKSKEKKQTTLILLRNDMMHQTIYSEFNIKMNITGYSNNINTFYEFKNGSTVFFKIYNRVEQPIFKYADNIIFYNIDLYKNNKLTIELLNKIINYNKKLFINCNFRDNSERVILMKINGKSYKKDHSYKVNTIDTEIRRLKIKKIKEKCYE